MAKTTKNATTENSNLYAAIAYLFGLVTGVLMLLVAPKDKYVKFHAMQSILLTVVVIIIEIILGVLTGMLAFATMGMGALLMAPLWMLLSLIMFIVWLLLMYKAYNGEMYKLPLVGNYAENMANK